MGRVWYVWTDVPDVPRPPRPLLCPPRPFAGALYTETLAANAAAQNYSLCPTTTGSVLAGTVLAVPNSATCLWAPISGYAANGTRQRTCRAYMSVAG